MRRGYGQYCPLALAAEMLCERWNLLIVSRVVDGCRQFSDIHRGVPRISPSLLSQRLRRLEHAGLIARERGPDVSKASYVPTPAGRDLAPIIDSLAVWGQHWARDMTADDLDPAFLLWSMHLRLNTEGMPPGRTVLQFDFTGTPTDLRRFWLVHEHENVDMCLKDPGFEVNVWVSADLRTFVEAWRGIRDLRQEIRAARIKITGPPALCRDLPRWLLGSALAPYPRKCDGKETRLAKRIRLRRRAASPTGARTRHGS